MTAEEENLALMTDCPNYNKWIYDEIQGYVEYDTLEVGSGVGNITSLINPHSNLIGTEINEKQLEYLKKKFPHFKFTKQDISQTIKGLPEFDTILCLNVLEHIKYDYHTIRNMKYLLRPGGKVVLQLPAHQWLYGTIDKLDGHHRRYDKKRIKHLLESNGFKIVKLKSFNFVGIPGWYYHGKLLKLETHKKGDLKLFDRLVPVFRIMEKIFFFLPGLSYIVVGVKE